jgi:hypothetical protein
MINEAKYRSPKWLRNFVDYEINTGEDIKGEPSKRRAEKLEKERKAELKRQADEREKQRKRQEEARREQQAREDVRKQQEQQDQIERELNTLYRSIISDFTANPYGDKIVTPRINGEVACNYRFENGKIIKFYKKANDNRHCLEWGDTTYTLGSIWTSKFISLFNEMIDKGRTRPQKSGYDRYNSYGGSSSSSGYKSGGTGSGPKKDNTAGHPKGNLYNTLKQTIKQREEQLSKMSKQDPSRVALENELATAKRKVAEMKTKYQFENLKSFEDFN